MRGFRLILRGFLLAGLLAGGGALAQTSTNSQQDRMKSCNAQAGTQNLAGDARKSFMSNCLSGKSEPTAPSLTAQQQKMKDCNAKAGIQKLTGDARKAFMSTCLKG